MRFALLAILVSCSADQPAVIVEISSDLSIPTETNSLVARIQESGTTLAEKTYTLGEAPNDRWPQTLPLLPGDGHGANVDVAAELRITAPGMPSVVVGYGERTIQFPNEGEETVTLDVPRSCVDADDDGFGIGFGCKRPDCDDTDPRVPAEAFCPGFGIPDAGQPADTGVVTDAGQPADAGDAGVVDTGPPDSGIELCGAEVCEPDETCLNQQCLQSCMNNLDCGSISYACLEQFGVCICRVPCFNGTQDCGPYQCVDGCCEIN